MSKRYVINHGMHVCCKGCVAPKRYPGCHDHCPERAAEDERIRPLEQKRAEEVSLKTSLDHYTIGRLDSIARRQHRRRKKGKNAE